MAPKRKAATEKKTSVSSKKSKTENEDAGSANNAEISDAKNKLGHKCNLKIISWNVDGLRAWVKKGGLSIFDKEDPDIIALQEIKCSEDKFPDEFKTIKTNYFSYIFSAKKEGYAGVALYSKVKPMSVQKGIDDDTHDDEGRCITAEYEDFYLIAAYVPNAGRKLVTLDKRMDWDSKFKEYIKKLDKKKPVIYCGDLNVAHNEIDLANPKGNTKNAGFTKEERDGFTDLLQQGFVDSFREIYPNKKDQYTFWTYMANARARNVGWRLDYFVLSKRIMDSVCDVIIKKEFMGSDHCPITLLINLTD